MVRYITLTYDTGRNIGLDHMTIEQWVEGALAESGYRILETDRTAILNATDALATDLVDKSLTALANNLPKGGIKSYEWGPLATAILASEPQINLEVIKQIAQLFDAIAAAVHNAVPAQISGGT